MSKDDSDATPRNLRVWLLGNAHPNADKSISWNDVPIPNLSDPDVLIVDLTTLTVPALEKINKAMLEQARLLVLDKILNRGTVVVITQPIIHVGHGLTTDNGDPHSPPGLYFDKFHVYSNYQIFPVRPATKGTPKGEAIVVDPGHKFWKYMDNVRNFTFYISDYFPRYISKVSGTSSKIELRAVNGQAIKDNSGHDLGSTLTAVVVDRRGASVPHENSGRLVFLPPPTEPIGDAIEKILFAYGKATPHSEAPPTWAEQLSLGPAGEYRAQIVQLKEDKAKIQGEIDRVERQNDAVMAHCRLLYSSGPELEDAIVQAFRVLGFDDTREMGGADEEDAAFAMDGTGYLYGVIEAKGASKGAQLQHILQCNRWTDLRAIADSRPSKGIFVPNQHRLEPYPESAEIRMKIEPNQLEQAEMKDICIIPSCVLFEAVSRVLGGETPDRARIAGKIAGTRGVLKDVL